MSTSNNPTPTSTDPSHGRSDRDKDAADAPLMLSQVSAQASSSAKGKEVADPDLSEYDSGPYEVGPDLDEADDEAEEDEQQAGPSSSSTCSECGKPSASRTGHFCKSCLNRRRVAKLKAEGRCIGCTKPMQGDKIRCDECAVKNHNKASRRKSNSISRASGKCCFCRRRQADPGMASCTMCRLKHNEARNRKKKSGKEDREEQSEN